MPLRDELIAEIQATFGIDNLRSLVAQEPRLLDFLQTSHMYARNGPEAESLERAMVAEREQSAAALRASEARFEATFNQAAVGIAHVAPDGSWLRVNQKLCDILGYTPNELVARTFQEITHPDDVDTDLENMRQLLNNERDQYTMEKRYIRKDGALVWSNLTVSLVRDANGTPEYFISVIENISERKHAESRLRTLADVSRLFAAESLHSSDLLETIATHIAMIVGDCCVISTVSDDKYILNPVAIFHRNPEALQLLRSLVRDMNLRSGIGLQNQVVKAGQALLLAEIHEDLMRHLLTSTYQSYIEQVGIASMLIVPIQAGSRFIGTLIMTRDRHGASYTQDDLVFVQDLVDRAALAINNHQLYREAQQAIHVREIFLSIAAHELRTPLTALFGNAQILERRATHGGVLTDRDLRSITIIREQGQRLNKLIEALLDVSRLQLGRFTISTHLFDFSRFVHRIIDEFTPTLRQHTIQATIPPGILIVGDELRLEQVLQNLLSNAVKYSPSGGMIEIRVEQQEEQIALHITDRGIGIPLSEQANLFAQFYRATNVDPKLISGLGIGLYLVQEIVAHHGGRVSVQSVPNQGSTFSVYLPRVTRPLVPITTDVSEQRDTSTENTDSITSQDAR